MIRVHEADVIDWLDRAIERGDKYHAVIADPPYGIAFMGKEFDSFSSNREYQEWVTEWASKLIEVLYPGGVVVLAGGTRTWHRLAVGMEDAGFETTDTLLAWTYGTGFPKSHNISKAIGENTPEGEQWDGYGTALKPAWEPFLMFRKPKGNMTYAEIAQQFGSGAYNIEGARIPLKDGDKNGHSIGEKNIGVEVNNDVYGKGNIRTAIDHNQGRFPANMVLVHYPDCTELECHPDCHVSNLDNRSNSASRYFYQPKAATWERNAGLENFKSSEPAEHNLSNNACANCGLRIKANGSGDKCECGDEREIVKIQTNHNPHPTVKPIQLIEHIATLLLPPIEDSRLLVPFSGSGSEMIGAYFAGWSHIDGIEYDVEYAEVARLRINWWTQFGTYDEANEARKESDKARRRVEKIKDSDNLTIMDLLEDD